MTSEQLLSAATTASLVWSVAALARLLARRRSAAAWLEVSAAATALGASSGVAAVVIPGVNPAQRLAQSITDGRLADGAVLLLGAVAGLALALACGAPQAGSPGDATRSAHRRAAALVAVALALFALTLAFAARVPLQRAWRMGGAAALWSGSPGWVSDPRYEVEELCACDFQPIQIAVGPDDDVYACYAEGRGGVARIHEDAQGRVSIREIATDLNRPQGLAFFEGELYVSRAGRYARAEGGRMIETDTGAVTLLRDLDGDGLMDFYDDVVTGLPGAQGPDPVHQNNGLAIAPGGEMYVTVGAHADRAPSSSPYEGTILRVRPPAAPEVLARGFRNPFDVALGPEGALFATDNDIGFERHDELNHVRPGRHYGHPYADERTPAPPGTVAPIWTYEPASLQGLCYCDGPQCPDDLRGTLLVVGFGPGEIHRVRLTPDGETYRAEAELFARVPHALDVACDDRGTIYVAAYADKKIYRIRHADRR